MLSRKPCDCVASARQSSRGDRDDSRVRIHVQPSAYWAATLINVGGRLSLIVLGESDVWLALVYFE